MRNGNGNIGQELLSLEKQYWQAMKDGDVATALRLTDDPCIVVGPSGIMRVAKDELAKMMQSAAHTLDQFEVRPDAEARSISDDVAVLAYKVHEELTVDGRPLVLDVADCSTWVRRGGQWVCAVHTETITGDPFGRDRTRRNG
jgi:ketosteroid isomerase-like protein